MNVFVNNKQHLTHIHHHEIFEQWNLIDDGQLWTIFLTKFFCLIVAKNFRYANVTNFLVFSCKFQHSFGREWTETCRRFLEKIKISCLDFIFFFIYLVPLDTCRYSNNTAHKVTINLSDAVTFAVEIHRDMTYRLQNQNQTSILRLKTSFTSRFVSTISLEFSYNLRLAAVFRRNSFETCWDISNVSK